MQEMENEAEDRVVEWSQNLASELASVWNEINLKKEKESLKKIKYLVVICFFHLVLLFWNQVLICTSVRFNDLESSGGKWSKY